jgi:ubiquinone/menaquinone biosynthesis C-methylase UbiE
VESKTHRLGASLARLLELVPAEPQWQVLDVAAAVGYTAYAFAPHVAHVWVTDITTEMLALARQEAADRGLLNVTVEVADAEALPYEAGRFDLVTCRIAPHHFGDIPRFVREAARVLAPGRSGGPGGYLAVVDNVVPDGPAATTSTPSRSCATPATTAACRSTNGWPLSKRPAWPSSTRRR